MQKPKVIVICVPTASVKTALSIELAKKINGEIISADSMQIYKDMDIGTAKPDKEEMQGIKHYLLDCISPDVRYSVAEYKQDATKAIEEILQKGKTPIIVGGTGLYVDTLIYGIEYNDIKIDEEYRRELEKIAEEQGLQPLYEMALKIDEEAMKKISSNDKKRIMRVLEIYKATGKTKTQQEIESRRNGVKYDYKVFALNMDREVLYNRINLRVDIMIKNGLLDEVKSFYDKNMRYKPLLGGIGYKELFSYYDGDIKLDEAIEERSFGEFEGKTAKEFDFDEIWNYKLDKQYEKAESLGQLFNRVNNFLDNLKQTYPDKTVLLVTHGGVCVPIRSILEGIPEEMGILRKRYFYLH